MRGYKVHALPDAISEAVRKEQKSPQYGHPAYAEVARGYGPCRACLRQFQVGEERRLLFTYNPFAGLSDYPSPGPVFIHEHDCERFEGDGFPDELRALPLMLEAYDDARRCVWLQPALPGVEEQIGEMLARPDVRYVHIRNAEAGCFIAHAESVKQEA